MKISHRVGAEMFPVSPARAGICKSHAGDGMFPVPPLAPIGANHWRVDFVPCLFNIECVAIEQWD
ncbi:hypothetical protein FAZ19_18960 [Sphingobacterium alkalisoli]|uniref:Uncharacterized protein n=1 Tax=Sphingobacterium alkalisoli TaxID=1874115 RepID=A0A4U0GU31_9SPHI|nr:hypothetical protein [Sphingobacterium alkalisoli]TJY62555.1 hypothetical protein FAZ19_18960 [Sphingobacterium alkalisoli]